ncbi:hypothetical protein ACO0SA_001884 [Hanseniaspora valbyensis]
MASKSKRISFYEVYNEDNNEPQYDMISSASIVDIKRKLRIYDDIKSQEEFKSILNESIDDIIKDFNKSNTLTDSERLNKINETYLGLSNIYSKPLKNNMIDKFEDETKIDDLYVESQHNELIPLKINLPDKLAKTSKKEKRKSLIYNGECYELLSDFCKPENHNNNSSTFNDSSVLSDTSQIIDLTFDSEEHDYSINYDEMFNNPTYLGFNESNDCFVKKQTANMISDNFKKRHSFEKKQKKLPILPLEEGKIDEGDDEINEEVIDLDLIEARTDTESISSHFSSETFQGQLDLCDHNEKNLFLDLNADYQDTEEEEIIQVPLRSPLRLSRDPQMHVAIAQSPILRNIDDISDENDDDSETQHDSSSFKFPSPLMKKQREVCNSDESFEFPPLTINKIKRVNIADNKNADEEDDYYYLDKNIDKGDDLSVENISVFEENFNTNDLISSISFPILSSKRLYSELNNGSGILSPSKLLNHEPLDYETSESKSVVDLLEETCQFAKLVIDDL